MSHFNHKAEHIIAVGLCVNRYMLCTAVLQHSIVLIKIVQIKIWDNMQEEPRQIKMYLYFFMYI